MPRPPLTVRRSPTGYVVHDPVLVRLADIDGVPLPFTSRAAPATVLAHLRRLSPHREVRFEHTLPFPLPSPPASAANRQVGEASDIPHPSCD